MTAVRTLLARIRMPLVATALVVLLVTVLLDLPPVGAIAGLVVVAAAVVAYVVVGPPRRPPVDLVPPVDGRWLVVHSPARRVPSHGVHAWSQTFAVDLVREPADGGRPGWTWWPLARRPEDFPAFGAPVRAPVAGEVVRAVGWTRDHWSRTSLPGLAWFLAESVRELLGPVGILGNHVVVRADDGACVLVAHLRRGSLRVRPGDRVVAGQVVATCGCSGNATEPHVHLQAMDHPSTWVAVGLPIRTGGVPLPDEGEPLATVG